MLLLHWFDVLPILHEPLGQLKVNQKYLMLELSESHQEVLRFDIPVHHAQRMQVAYSLQHLKSQHEGGLQRKSSIAFLFELFQIASE